MNLLLPRIHERIKDYNLRNSTSRYRIRNNSPRIYPPVDLPTVRSAEAKLGFRLPNLLSEIYSEVANGGIGPGHGGIYGLAHGYPAINEYNVELDLVENYYLYRGPNPLPAIDHDFSQGSLFSVNWFDRVLPICAWGDNHYSCIDCSKEGAPVLFYVGYGGEFSLHGASFDSWMEEWVDGVDLWKKVMNT
jgi:SMI1 / KNR4 family (SUKH-1)